MAVFSKLNQDVIIGELKISLGKNIGQGMFGTVYEGRWQRRHCAAKMLKCLSEALCNGNQVVIKVQEAALEGLKKECNLLKTLRHPNIVTYYATVVHQFEGSSLPILVMELMHSSISDYLTSPSISHVVQLKLCRDIASALDFIHGNDIIHRDLCGDNILVTKPNGDIPVAKIADFGMSRLICDSTPGELLSPLGNHDGYLPPEATYNEDDTIDYDYRLDIYMLGAVMGQIAGKHPTFRSKGERQELEKELDDAKHPLMPIIHGCLNDRKEDRPTASRLCNEIVQRINLINAVIQAATQGDWQQMKSLLDANFTHDITNLEGKSLLIVATEGGHELVIQTLLDGGADIDFIQETSGKTALFFAAKNGHHEATATLLAYGANCHHADKEGKSPLIVATEGGHELVLLTLLAIDGTANIEFIQETTGKTALFFAAENGHHEATAILLAYRADRHQTDKAGKTPYSVAKQSGHEKVCEELAECDSSKRPSVRTFSTQQWVSESVEEIRDTVLGKAITMFRWMFSDIIGATKAGDIKLVMHILEHSKDLDAFVNYRDSNKHEWTSLMWACDRGYHKIVDLLLAKGADPDIAAKSNGWSSLMLASRRGYLRIVKTLLEHGAFPDQQNNAGETALAFAIYEGRTAVALLLLHRGANVNLPDETGWTPLIRASNEGNLKLVKVISDLGGYINAQTEENWTSLMVASDYGHTEVVRELAKRGADFNLSTKAGDTALHIATTRKNHGVVKELAKLGANLNESNKDGLTALMVAADKGYEEVVDALLEGGANVNYQHKETDWTALFFAAKNGHVDVFQSLLSYGAKTEITDKDGNSLPVIDVASHLKQMHILSAMGTPVDFVPIRKELETAKVDMKVRLMDSFILALEKKLAIGGLKM